MMQHLPSLTQLIKQLQRVPYLASKNVYRVAHHILSMDEQKAKQFCSAIEQAKQNIEQCSICFSWKETTQSCSLCTSAKRDKNLICVVETWHDLMTLEMAGGYQGVYHVLGGVIYPLEGIGPEDLTIESLVKRVKAGNIKEVILATNQTPEGEATAAYIAKKLPDDIVISCLARGIPIGSSLQALDRLTVYKALSERRPF